MLFPGRVGSTYLISGLDEHPDVRAEGERLDGLRARGAQAQLEWADRYLRGPLVGGHRAVGFKTKPRDVLDPGAFGELLRARRARIVLLGRRNDVKHAVSRITAKALHESTNRWNRFDESEKVPPVTVDVDDFDRRIRQIVADKEAVAAYAEGLGLPMLRLDYEELLVDPDAAFGLVLDFVGVRRMALRGRTLKNTSDDLRDAVANLDELRSRYAGTEHEPMFDEIVHS